MIGELEKFLQFEIQNPNLWEFIFLDSPDIKYRIQSSTLPFFGFKMEDIYHYHFPVERPMLEPFSLTFIEDNTFSILNLFKSWRNEIYDDVRKVFRIIPESKQDNAKKDAILIYQKFETSMTSGQSVMVLNRQYKFKGLFPEQISEIENSYNEDGPFTVKISFTVDEVILEYPT